VDEGNDDGLLKRLSLREAWVKLAIAVIGLIVVVLGLLSRGGQAGPEPTTTTEASRSSTSSSQPPPSTTRITSSTSSTSPGVEVRRETGDVPYQLEYGREFDLDSPPGDGDWGLLSGGSDVSLQIGSIERRLGESGTSARMAIVDSPPSYETCGSEEGLLYKQSLDTAEVVSGRMLCYQTSEGRWAYVHIVNLDDEARVATFEIVVWKLPTDP
jgi:hypothetical protein